MAEVTNIGEGKVEKLLTCKTPIYVLQGQEIVNDRQPEPCGRPAICVVTISIMGVKVFMEHPMCNTCAEAFKAGGVQVFVQPTSELVIAGAGALNKMKRN
jgi:hypothetical protein